LPQRSRPLRRRNHAFSNTGSGSGGRGRGSGITSANMISRCRSRCPAGPFRSFICLLLGVIGLTTLIFVLSHYFSNRIRQYPSTDSVLIKLVNVSSSTAIHDVDASSTAIILLPSPSSSATTTTSTTTRSISTSATTKTPAIPALVSSSHLNLPPCDADCQIHRRQRLSHSGGVDLLSVTDMITAVQAKKQALLDILGAPDQYGDLADLLFTTGSGTTNGTSSGNGTSTTVQSSPLSSQLLKAVDATTNPSRDRLRDKLQRKVLQVQLEIIQQDNRPTAAAMDSAYRNAHRQDDAAAKAIRDHLSSPFERRVLQQQPSVPPMMVPAAYKFQQTSLVWATAGHGASAGHGNLAKESYTAILEQAAGPVFRAAGIELKTRNYGWAGAKDNAAPELALCLDSVYGTDVDILA
jgi:hypothetical protein